MKYINYLEKRKHYTLRIGGLLYCSSPDKGFLEYKLQKLKEREIYPIKGVTEESNFFRATIFGKQKLFFFSEKKTEKIIAFLKAEKFYLKESTNPENFSLV